MDHVTAITRAKEHIEAHLQDEITLTGLAAAVDMSPYHFHRVFGGIVGCGVMTYVRTRRLECAADDLVCTAWRILDIAVTYQFESQEAFTRAFTQMFGVTPGRYRTAQRTPHVPRALALAVTRNESQGGTIMDARMITRPEFSVVGMELPNLPMGGEQPLIYQLWDDFMPRYAAILHRDREQGTYGLCFIDAGDGTFTYMAAAAVTSPTDVPAGMVVRTVPAARYAVFTHRGPVRGVSDTFDQIYAHGLSEAGCERASGPDLEMYAPGYDPTAPDGTMEIAIPIK